MIPTELFRRRMPLTISFALAAACLLPQFAQAEDLPTFPIRELVIRCPDIVVAKPVGECQGKSWRFQVDRVLKGSRTKPGETITVRRMDLYHVGEPQWGKDKPAKPPQVVEALLFLARTNQSNGNNDTFALEISGIRCRTADGKVLCPRQWMNPGNYYLSPEKPETNVKWDQLIAQVTKDIPIIDKVLSLRKIKDPAKRNQAIFKWIDEHHGEFTNSPWDRANPGWGSLERRVFCWILETCRAEDGWKALKLYRQIAQYPGYGPGGNEPTFEFPGGRRLLLAVATDPKQPIEDRRMALYHLMSSFWPRHHYPKYPGLANVSPEEQTEMINRVSPLLKDKDAEMRGLATRALDNVSDPRDGALSDRTTQAALPALIAAYGKEPPGNTRNKLAEAIRDLGGEKRWKDVSGNPGGMLVILYSFSLNNNYGREKIHFSMLMPGVGGSINTIQRQPTLILERLAADGKIAERKTMPLPVDYPKDIWTKGWHAYSGMISADIPSAKMAEGPWRFTVEGVAGKDSQHPWRSEPGLFELKRGNRARER